MDKIIQFKKEREGIDRIVSVPIESTRSKFETSDRQIKGYAIVWGSKNDYGEIVVKGACANSIQARGVNGSGKNKIVVLNQHRQTEPIALLTRLEEDDYGLYFEADVIEGVSYADEALASIRQGLLNQLSYGFNYVWDKTEYDFAQDAYILREIKLFEISVVTFSSDENAQLRSFKDFQSDVVIDGFTIEQLEGLKKAIELRKASRDEHSQEPTEEPPVIINKPNFF
jgi:HK97 family phage prohead protease